MGIKRTIKSLTKKKEIWNVFDDFLKIGRDTVWKEWKVRNKRKLNFFLSCITSQQKLHQSEEDSKHRADEVRVEKDPEGIQRCWERKRWDGEGEEKPGFSSFYCQMMVFQMLEAQEENGKKYGEKIGLNLYFFEILPEYPRLVCAAHAATRLRPRNALIASISFTL